MKGTWENINVEFDKNIGKQLFEILDDFEDETAARAEEIIKEKSYELCDLIKERSPYNNTSKTHYTHYRDGWKVKTRKFGVYKIYIISNQVQPTLTHLMERGWINQHTGKLVGRHPHIERSYNEIQEKLMEALLKLL